MKIEIDQSGKIEQTNLDTIIALSNGIKYSLLLRKKDKRILQQYFRTTDKYSLFPYITFSICIALIIKNTSPGHLITIDNEYQGHEQDIKQFILFALNIFKSKKKFSITFAHIGKSSPADKLASKVANNKIKPHLIINYEDIINIFLDIKKDREPT